MQRDRSWLRPASRGLVVRRRPRRAAWRLGRPLPRRPARGSTSWSLAAGAAIAVLTTVCGAWRWRLVARGLGARRCRCARRSPRTTARSSSTRPCPAGCSGDVHRACGTAATAATSGAGCGRSRGSGWPARSCWSCWPSALVLPAVAAVGARPRPDRRRRQPWRVWPSSSLAARRAGRPPPRSPRRPVTGSYAWWRAAVADLRAGCWDGIRGRASSLAPRSSSPGTRRPSCVAARTAGVTAPVTQLLPLALVVLVAMGRAAQRRRLGPREGVAAWAFGAAGLGAAGGVATAVVYGVMVVRREPARARRCSPWRVATDGRQAARRRRTGPPVADRPYTLLSCGMSIDGYLGAGDRDPAAAVQRRRLRPGRRGAGRLRRDPGRRRDGPQTTTRGCSSARPSGAPRGWRAGSPPSPVKVTVTRRAELGPCRSLLRRRRRRQAGLLPQRRGARAPARGSARVATVVDAGRPVDAAPGQRGPRRAAACAG